MEARFRIFTSKDGLVAGQIHAVTQTPDGMMWFGAHITGTGVSRFDGNEFVSLSFEPNTAAPPILKMAAAPDGVLWLGTPIGLLRYDGTNTVNVTREAGFQIQADSPDIGADGEVWFTGGGKLWRYKETADLTDMTAFRGFDVMDGLVGGDPVASLRGKDGIIWTTTREGVSRFDGTNFVNFTTATDLPIEDVITLIETSDGAMWFGSRQGGLLRYEPQTFGSLLSGGWSGRHRRRCQHKGD